VAIDPQPATTPLLFSARPPATRPPHRVVLVERPSRTWTLAKLAGLVTVTTLGVALTAAVVVGAVVFAILNIGSVG
jgi:hypothetical protein